MQPLYKVPIVPNNLRHKETIIQIADALNYIDKVYDDIFLRINKSIIDKQNKVSTLQSRITVVSEKVVRLTQTKKATQVFSNSKYPVTENNEKYKSIFAVHDKETAEVVLNKINIKLKDPMLTDQQTTVLQFYHVKIKNYMNDKNPNASMEGLGSFPVNAHIINELLLFNTSKNPYKKYEMSDPFNLQIEENKKLDEMERNGPDAAPKSMTNRLASVQAYKEDYFYSPDLGEVPTIDVPLDLPDLPGVADDLRYVMEGESVIAPSIQTTPVVPDLPPVSSPQSIPSPQIDTKTVTEPNIPTQVDSNEPILEVILPEVPKINESDSITLSVPLPEIPVSIPKTDVDSGSGSTTKAVPKVDVSAEARANLMEAIRQAGSLRKTKPVPDPEADTSTPKSQGAPHNDLMSDLHAKLALRRKGISGTRAGGIETNSAMSRISAMIPAPTPNNDAVDSSATEEENADWEE